MTIRCTRCCLSITRFNTASGMRSHVTKVKLEGEISPPLFQYRKRYEVTCDEAVADGAIAPLTGFNTASGMRSHVTPDSSAVKGEAVAFQYRKRYEVTCDHVAMRLLDLVEQVSIPQAV